VMIDNIPASEAATRYLIQLGHRRIAYIGCRGGSQADSERFEGYRRALCASGLVPCDEFVLRDESISEGGMRAMEQLLNLPNRPTAVFCYNDMCAIGAIRSAQTPRLRLIIRRRQPTAATSADGRDETTASFMWTSWQTRRNSSRHADAAFTSE